MKRNFTATIPKCLAALLPCNRFCDAFVFVLTMVYLASSASGAIINVPADQPSIHAGIQAAETGDIVLVAPGIYTGLENKNLDPRRKEIMIISESGPETCIIDCENEGRGFFLHSFESDNVLIEGFTICNGNADRGGGIYCYHSYPTIYNCILTNNHANEGGGICIVGTYSDTIKISDCVITNNSASESGGGIYFGAAYTDLNNCIISMNTADEYGGGVYFWYRTGLFNHVTFTDNVAGVSGGGIYVKQAGVTISDSIFWNDQPEELFLEDQKRINATYSDIMVSTGTYPGDGNINTDPLLISNGTHGLYLSQIAAGQTQDSPCLDSGSIQSSDACYSLSTALVCMNEWSTRTDSGTDIDMVDMGYHHPPVDFITPTPVATPSPTVTPDNIDLIWIEDAAGSPDEQVTVEIWISNPDTSISAFTLYIWWDTEMLTFTHGTSGDLNPGWLMFDCCQPEPERIIMAGFSTETSIPPGSTGCLGQVYFDVECESCFHMDSSMIVLDSLSDDLSGFQPSTGIFTFLDPSMCVNSGDVNFDEQITTEDSLIAFMIMLGASATFEERCAADCNADENVTAGDAQQIFLSVLGHDSCVDPLRESSNQRSIGS